MALYELKVLPPVPEYGGISKPKIIKSSQVLPRYPKLARRNKIERRVVLMVVIQKDGTVGEIRVISVEDTKLGFDEAAITAVKRWRYQPALKNDEPVNVLIFVLVDFYLQR